MATQSLFNFPWSGSSSFEDIHRMRRQMDRLFDMMYFNRPTPRQVGAGVFPLINITEDANGYRVRAEMPGVKNEDLEVQVVGRNLTISGERKIKIEAEGARYHRREREAGKFSRVVSLPGDFDGRKVEAKAVNGILTVTLPKSEAARPRQITVK